MKQVVAQVISTSQVVPGVYLIWLESPQIAAIARPGQFVMVRCGEDTLLRRPLSVHQLDGDKIALLFEVVGKGTAWLSQCKASNDVDIFGPLGNGFSVNSTLHNMLLVAGGVGIAPLRFLADEAIAKGHSVKLLYGARTAAELLPEQMFPVKIKVATATDDGTAGREGVVTSLLILPDLVSDFSDWADQVFACGPLPMYKTMAQMPELRNKPVQVSLEVRMGCGRGICYGCTVKTKKGLKQVCKDGPVFDLDDVLWEELDC